MSAQLIYDLVPLGSIVRFSDGAPRPAERHHRKLSAWESNNSGGRLIRKWPEKRTGATVIPASFALHIGDYGGDGVVLLRHHCSFNVTSNLDFTVVELPKIGSVLVLERPGESAELVHVAESRAAAEIWLQSHGYPDAVIEDVTVDAIAREAVEGRAAA